MTKNAQDNQTLLENLVAVSAAIKEARSSFGTGYYVSGADRPVYNRLVKANDAIAEAIAVASKRIG